MLKLVSNPPLRYSKEEIQWLDGEVPPANLKIYQEQARSIISTNESPDVGFKYGLNPYRGCFHGCAYCYARRTHPYIDFGAGTDFERKLVVKINAPTLLRAAFLKRSWLGDTLAFSGVTDCYQPLELSYRLTRACLEVCLEFSNPVIVITKGAIIQRDIDLLQQLHKQARIQVYISIAFCDDQVSRKIEPGAPRPSTRLRALKALSAAGIPCGVGVAPIIPGLNEAQIAEILTRAKENGANKAFIGLLRLPGEVAPVFTERLQQEFPNQASKVLNELRELRHGKLNNLDFAQRMRGQGPRWEAIKWLFNSTCEKLGLNKTWLNEDTEKETTFKRPSKPEPQQLSLWS